MAPSKNVWDTHVHLLDPEYYSENRTYTPPAATVSSLLAASHASNFLLVQATVERDESRLLEQLSQLQSGGDRGIYRAAILHDMTASLSAERIAELHRAGVRCLRIHNLFRSDPNTMAESITGFLRGPTVALISKYRWTVSLRLSLQTWAELKSALEQHSLAVAVIAEHCGGTTWPLADEDQSAFEMFLEMLRNKSVYVKLGALHRRVRCGHTVSELGLMIEQLAHAGPQQLLWGSDWPHVDPESKGLVESPFLEINERAELELMQRNMSHDCFQSMLITAPAKLFG